MNIESPDGSEPRGHFGAIAESFSDWPDNSTKGIAAAVKTKVSSGPFGPFARATERE